ARGAATRPSMVVLPAVGSESHQRGEVMSAWGGIWPAATKRTSLLALIRPQPVIWSQPAAVAKRWEAGRVVATLLGGPHSGGAGAQRGVEKSISSAASRKSCLA